MPKKQKIPTNVEIQIAVAKADLIATAENNSQ